MIVDISKIFYIRCMQSTFLVDFIASMPIELSSYIFFARDDDKLPALCFFQLNRLLRFWRVSIQIYTFITTQDLLQLLLPTI